MMSSPVSEASTSSQSVESKIRTSGSEEEGGVDQFPSFPGRLVSNPPRLDAFKEFCKAMASIGGRWGSKSQVKMKESLLDTAARLMKGICPGVEEKKAKLKRKKVKLERNVARLKYDLSKEGKRLEALRASQVVEINKLQAETRVNLEEAVAKCDRLGDHLMSKGYSEDEVDVIRANTYMEGDEGEETEDVTAGIMDGLDGVSPQTVRDNQGDNNERPELVNGKVELESACLRKDDARQCNQEFTDEFDRLREANGKRRSTCEGALQVFYGNTNYCRPDSQIEENDANISKGQKELEELKEHAAKIKSQSDALVVKRREADIARCRIHTLERSEEEALSLTRSKKIKNDARVPLVQGDVVSLSARIRELERDVARIQGHVRKGVEQLRECQIKLGAALIWEKGLEYVIIGKDIVIKDK
ncbi:hypothetical protein GIB67_028327 [Kingdonia uniflora]|uniref:Uncharacterized protein n=1 Tax=Kingdonia uniflora TaxID=39325 RepID=A0A7J7MHN8_9MAGN|nr:hypothetical protein GIB67_028327 [Kingdonia uniflora]